jgi:hypothetical protein
MYCYGITYESVASHVLSFQGALPVGQRHAATGLLRTRRIHPSLALCCGTPLAAEWSAKSSPLAGENGGAGADDQPAANASAMI